MQQKISEGAGAIAHPVGDGGLNPALGLTLAVFGSNCAALATAAGLASLGHRVSLIVTDPAALARLQCGKPPSDEPGFAETLSKQVAAGRLRLEAELPAESAGLHIAFVAVSTSVNGDGEFDTAAVDRVGQELSRMPRPPAVVALLSDVPVGGARRLQALFDASADLGHATPTVLSVPAFMREGTALQDFMQPDRILIGSDEASGAGLALLSRVFAPLIAGPAPLLTMDTVSAELARCAGNAMLALRVSFINEIAAIAAATGADIEQVCEGLGSDPRIGRGFLKAGSGYGGQGLPGDLAALRLTARVHSLRADMLLATERVNFRQHTWAFEALQRDLGNTAALRGVRVAIWGLSFKPGSASMRDAPSLALIERLVRAGVFVQLYDPAAMLNARELVAPDRRVIWADSAGAALANADALMLLTDWPEFVEADPAAVAAALRQPLVYDGRNALATDAWRAAGLRVVQVGRSEPRRHRAVLYGRARSLRFAVPPLSESF